MQSYELFHCLYLDQLCQFLPEDYFEYLINRYDGNKYIKSFTNWYYFTVLLWAQLSGQESLRGITGSLNAHKTKFIIWDLEKAFAAVL